MSLFHDSHIDKKLTVDTGAAYKICQGYVPFSVADPFTRASPGPSFFFNLIGAEPLLVQLEPPVLTQLFHAKVASMEKSVVLYWEVLAHIVPGQVAALQEERNSLLAENDVLTDRAHQLDTFDDPSTLSGRKHNQLQQQLELLQEENFRCVALFFHLMQKPHVAGTG